MQIRVSNLQKLTSVLTTSFSIAGANIEDNLLNWVFCIYYLNQFKENKMQALINLSSEINAMTLEYTLNLGLKVCFINIIAEKIDGSTLKMLKIVLTSF